MNHLGDTNKMVSETPISDSTPHNVADLGMQIRRIERKLNAANAEVDRLTAKVAQLYKGAEEQKQRIKRLEEMYEKEIGENDKFIGTNLQALLTRELNAANERIKRLEEALEGTVKCFVDLADSGDAGFWNPEEQSVIIAARAALEAKEDKL